MRGGAETESATSVGANNRFGGESSGATNGASPRYESRATNNLSAEKAITQQPRQRGHGPDTPGARVVAATPCRLQYDLIPSVHRCLIAEGTGATIRRLQREKSQSSQ